MKHWLIPHQQLFTQQLQQGKLPHAVLIHSVAGAGKQALAQWLVDLLICQQPVLQENAVLAACKQCKQCLLSASNTFPDHLTLAPENKSLGVDEVRFANQFLQSKAHIGHFKTVLIPFAEKMTHQAANALLKTLEEPNANSVLILLSEDVERLLPTIISRCRLIAIRPAVGNALKASLTHLPANTVMTPFTNLTHLPELNNENINKEYQEFEKILLRFFSDETTNETNQGDEKLLLAVLVDNKNALRWLEKIVVNLQRAYGQNTSAISQEMAINSETLHQMYKIILASSKVLKSYVQSNSQFVMEQLLMDITLLKKNKKRHS